MPFVRWLKVAVLAAAFAFSVQSCQQVGPVPPGGAGGAFALLAWNDLGMHCIDGVDYSVFSILPPFNNLYAQLVDRATGEQVRSGVTLTYRALRDASGSINTYSAGKTDFWDYVGQLYGAAPPADVGLTGNPAPSLTPAPLAFDAGLGVWSATGIPLTPYDDGGAFAPYPMVRVTARDDAGAVLAMADVVLPVSDEMSCAACHASRATGNAAQMAAEPPVGWVFDADPVRDWKRNILALHDATDLGSAAFDDALAAAGYPAAGLLASADAGGPILCAACHASNALPGTGQTGVEPLTEALHGSHGSVLDPATLATLDGGSSRDTCYLCHPGSTTQCLRGAMGKATDAGGAPLIACQDCHGDLSTVGATGRTGWLDEPTCQACHHDGLREVSARDAAGNLREVLDTRFATNAGTPAAGFSLFRMSTGHGDLQCEACHGSTHAIFPSSEANDNVLAVQLQGHAGTIAECGACHADVPLTTTGGPHGVHTVGAAWVRAHGDVAERSSSSCSACHGADYRGTALAATSAARSFTVEGATHAYAARESVSCYDCHDGPGGGD